MYYLFSVCKLINMVKSSTLLISLLSGISLGETTTDRSSTITSAPTSTESTSLPDFFASARDALEHEFHSLEDDASKKGHSDLADVESRVESWYTSVHADIGTDYHDVATVIENHVSLGEKELRKAASSASEMFATASDMKKASSVVDSILSEGASKAKAEWSRADDAVKTAIASHDAMVKSLSKKDDHDKDKSSDKKESTKTDDEDKYTTSISGSQVVVYQSTDAKATDSSATDRSSDRETEASSKSDNGAGSLKMSYGSLGSLILGSIYALL